MLGAHAHALALTLEHEQEQEQEVFHNAKAPAGMAGASLAHRNEALSLAGGADGIADGGERLIGIRSQRGNGGDAHHDDERQHDGVFDRSGPIFLVQEISHPSHHFAHCLVPFGNLAIRSVKSADPWFCAPALQRVCHFEETRLSTAESLFQA